MGSTPAPRARRRPRARGPQRQPIHPRSTTPRRWPTTASWRVLARSATTHWRGVRRQLQDRAYRRPRLAESQPARAAVVEYVGWFKTIRLHQALGDVPRAEFKALEGLQNVAD